MLSLKRLSLYLLATAFFTVASLLITHSPASAQSQCELKATSFSGIANVTSGEYDVYVQLDKSGQAEGEVSALTSTDGSHCQEVGTLTASSDTWQKAGSTTVDSDQKLQFILTSDELDLSYQYDRPSLLLISKSTPSCQPTTECMISVQGETASLQLSPTEPDTGTLRLYIPRSVDTSSIQSVSYYADSALMYKTNSLEQFDPQSIPYNTKTLSRVIMFSDGQSAVIEQAPAPERPDSLSAMLLRTARKYQVFLIWVAVLVALLIVYYIIRLVMYLHKQRTYWRYAHGLIQNKKLKAPKPTIMARLYQMGQAQRTITGLKILTITAAVGIGALVLIDGFVAQFTTVHDASMQQALQPGQQVYIDKTGATFALINQSDFVPQRGQIVAIRQSADNDTLTFRRVIGLPGDRVIISGPTVTVYDAENTDGINPEADTAWGEGINPDTSDQLVDMQLNTSQLFLLGDNRPGAIDSRQTGPVPLKNIVGVVRFVQ